MSPPRNPQVEDPVFPTGPFLEPRIRAVEDGPSMSWTTDRDGVLQ